MQAENVAKELQSAAWSEGYEFSDASASHLTSQLKLAALGKFKRKERIDLYRFMLENLDKTFSKVRNREGEIILHEPDADRLVMRMQGMAKSSKLGRIKKIWCAIIIVGCPK